MHKRNGNYLSKGFTIVELLIVIVIIGILAAIVTAAFAGVTERARHNVVKQSLSQVNRALVAYINSDNGESYPSNLIGAKVVNDGKVSLQYSYNNDVTPKTYCVTGVLDGVSYFITSTNSQPTSGACPGHGVVAAQTAGGWDSYPIPWSTASVDHGYGLLYGAYYPSTLRAENSGSLTLFNPLARNASQGGVRTYLWCRNTSTNVISSTITGPTFGTFSTGTETQTITWSCPTSTVLYAFGIGSTPPVSNNDPDSAPTKSRMWYSQQSPNYKAPQPYNAPTVATDAAGWVTMPIPWGGATYSDMGYGPYYGIYIANDPAKNLSVAESGVFQLNNPYSSTRAQGGVNFYYWCRDTTTGLVGSNQQASFATFNSATTRELSWSCAAGSVLFAATIGSTMSSTNYPNELASGSKTRFWFSGDTNIVKASYLESIRIKHGE